MSESIVDVGCGVRLAHEQLGDPSGTPVLLIAGLGQQLHAWPDELCQLLVDQAHHVVRLDNRDVGRSTHFDFVPKPWQVIRGSHPEQYILFDLARDTVGLMDALGIESAHLVGMSMGGMIAQTIAARFPERVRTLTSIMSNTGAKKVGRPARSTWRLMATGKPPKSADQAADGAVRMFRHIASAGFPFDEEAVRAEARLAYERDPGGAAGVARQLGGIFKSGDRTQELRRIKAPTLVIHGDRDLLVDTTGGHATAKAISGARLEIVPGMGHDLPRELWPTLGRLMTTHFGSVAARR